MFTISYTPPRTSVPQPVKFIGATIGEGQRTTINFTTLEDAFEAACAVRKAGCTDVYVSSQEDPECRYMIPKRYW